MWLTALLNRDFPLGVNLAATGIPPFEKGGLGGDLNVARIRKSPSIPLFQRGKPVEFSNGKSRLKTKWLSCLASFRTPLLTRKKLQNYPKVFQIPSDKQLLLLTQTGNHSRTKVAGDSTTIKGTSKNPTIVAILRCSQKIAPYISNICRVAIFCSRLVSLRNLNF